MINSRFFFPLIFRQTVDVDLRECEIDVVYKQAGFPLPAMDLLSNRHRM